MFDLRPVFHVIGLLVCALAVAMLVPLAVDIYFGNPVARVFGPSAAITGGVGALCVFLSRRRDITRISIQQTFIMTTSVWFVLPIFGALPFLFCVEALSVTDAFFEAMSGLTTTGATIFDELNGLPEGLLIWRALLQWIGGIGIIVVAMVFLPELRVGGMQIFRTQGFDTFGKILPRASEIASSIAIIYTALTTACFLAYLLAGMGVFDAIAHAMTTVSTGGFSTRDASFGEFSAAAEYAGVVFMILAALPFVRYVQLLAGTSQPLLRDSQIRAFFVICSASVIVMSVWLWATGAQSGEPALRKALFNLASLLTGTGYASADYMHWGGFAIMYMFFLGLIGGCAGSTSCSIKVFRYQILIASVTTQIKRIHSPSGIFALKYNGRPVDDDVLNSVMSFFVFFLLTLGVVAVALSLTGLDMITSVSGAAAALANIGPGLGETIGPSGTYAPLNDLAKWILVSAMILGRLEILAVFALLTPRFWRG